jgi:hypothetical protein
VKTIAAPGDQLVSICLVTDIPDDLIAWAVENKMQGNGQFDGSKTGGQMAAAF